MSKEREGSQRISRRKFLTLAAGWFGVATAASVDLSSIDLSWFADIPEALPEKKIPYPLSGWLETSLPDRPALLTPNQGHKDYLRYFCLNHPVLKETLRQAYQDIFSGKIASSPKLGDYLNLLCPTSVFNLSDVLCFNK